MVSIYFGCNDVATLFVKNFSDWMANCVRDSCWVFLPMACSIYIDSTAAVKSYNSSMLLERKAYTPNCILGLGRMYIDDDDDRDGVWNVYMIEGWTIIIDLGHSHPSYK